MKTIDMTPTWEETARMCIAILTDSDNDVAIKTASDELQRMGRNLDQLTYPANDLEKAFEKNAERQRTLADRPRAHTREIGEDGHPRAVHPAENIGSMPETPRDLKTLDELDPPV